MWRFFGRDRKVVDSDMRRSSLVFSPALSVGSGDAGDWKVGSPAVHCGLGRQPDTDNHFDIGKSETPK